MSCGEMVSLALTRDVGQVRDVPRAADDGMSQERVYPPCAAVEAALAERWNLCSG